MTLAATPLRRRAILAGAVSALAALAVAEVAGLIAPGRPSIVLGIANQVIDHTPAELREWLISIVGTADKTILGIGIVVVILGTGALVGSRYPSRPTSAWPPYLLLGVVLGALTAGSISGLVWSLTVAIIGAAVGWAVLCMLLRAVPGNGGDRPALPRRTFLITSGLVVAASTVGISLLAATRRNAVATVENARQRLHLPKPATPPPTVPPGAAVDIAGMDPPVTSNADFYRIDTSLVPPAINVDTWSLTINGRVNHPLDLSYSDLMDMPQVAKFVTLACVSNPVGGDLVGNALWQGVPLRTLLDLAGIAPDAQQVVGEAVDGFTTGFPLAIALDGREPLIAVGMNGQPLPVAHGFPARLVVPGLYGYVSATKWLNKIRLATFDEVTPYWVDNGWNADGTIQPAARIDVPRPGSDVQAGLVSVAGRAWHQNVPIGGVEISVDDGTWNPATLADSMGIQTWRLWSWPWQATPGEHSLRVRMIDKNGTVQSATEVDPGPGPASGYMKLDLRVH